MDKDLINKIAKSFLNTPHVNGGNIKGAGLDCCTLPAHIFNEMGLGHFEIVFGYSGDWFCQKNCEEILLPYLEKYCDRCNSLEVGDVISYRWGRAQYAHLAVYIGDKRVIHCMADTGTEITDITDPRFFDAKGHTRVTGFWRLKGVSI